MKKVGMCRYCGLYSHIDMKVLNLLISFLNLYDGRLLNLKYYSDFYYELHQF